MIPEFLTIHLLGAKRESQREHTACPVSKGADSQHLGYHPEPLGPVRSPPSTHPFPSRVHFPSFLSFPCKCGCSCLALLLDFQTHMQFLTSWPLLNFSVIKKSLPPPGQASQWVVRSQRKRF